MIGQDGSAHRFTHLELHSMVDNVIETMASQGLRTICIAYRDFVKGTIFQSLQKNPLLPSVPQ